MHCWNQSELEFCWKQVGVSMAMGVPQERWMVRKGKSHLEMDDLGVPPFMETSAGFKPRNKM